MMKTPFRLMMIGLVVTSLLASCKKNNNDNNGGTANGQGFRATTEQGAGNNTRTHIDGLNPTAGGTSQVLWDDADLIKVRNNAGTVHTYQLTDGKDTPNGIFYTGEPHDNFFQPNYTAIYPAFNADDVANTITGEGTAQFTLPATQSYVANSFAKGAMPMMAVSENQTLPFKNVLGGLCFPIVGNLTVKKIVLTSANTADRLNGVFDANYNNGEPTLTHNTDDGDNGDNTITLMCNPAVQLDATNPTDFIVMVPPGMLESGFAITAYGETDNVIYTKSTSTAPGADFIQRKLIRKTNANLEVVEYTVSLSANPTAGGTVTGGGIYYYGTSCMVTATANSGYAFSNWTEGGTVVSSNATYSFDVTANRTLVANFRAAAPAGVIDGLYSVATNRKVYFSQGNLQYKNGTGWRLAPHQWDAIRSWNTSNWVDLFGWGTSGFHFNGDDYNHHYSPLSTSTGVVHQSYNYYGYGPSSVYLDAYEIMYVPRALVGASARFDWGVNNAVRVGETETIIPAGSYRTMTEDEWNYLMITRTVTVGGTQRTPYGWGTVNGCSGVILLPDNWDGSACTTFGYGESASNSFSGNAWTAMEAAGCVFLPATGMRSGGSVTNGQYAYYWSTTNNVNFGGSRYSFATTWTQGSVRSMIGLDCYQGCSVRLVKDAH